MIIALYALAAAMIVGGLLAAVLGWDIVLVERGWTMVISGIIGASSGALLIGIASIVSRLTRIHDDLARVQISLEDEIETVVVPTPAEQARGRMLGDVGGAPAHSAALDRLAAGGIAGGLASALFGGRGSPQPVPVEDPDQPILPHIDDTKADIGAFGEEEPADVVEREGRALEEPLGAEPAYVAEPAYARESAYVPEPYEAGPSYRAEPDDVSEAKVPDFLFAERYTETTFTQVTYPDREVPTSPYQEPHRAPESFDEPLMSPGAHLDEPEAEPEVPTAEVEPEVESESVTEPEAEQPDEEAQAAPSSGEPPSVIGTYNSGDNQYVMYSDGSIEAETPQGFYRFASLDELKEFIAGGGENPSPVNE